VVGLIDIAPRTETVEVQGTPVPVHGISARGLAQPAWPLPRAAQADDRTRSRDRPPDGDGGDAVAAVIAAGCGYPGDQAAENVAGQLSLDAQVDILAATSRLTLPGGFGPFVEKLTALGGLIQPAAQAGGGDDPSVTAPDSN
jgi:hypothetical protein